MRHGASRSVGTPRGGNHWQREARPVLRELVGLHRIAQQTRGHVVQVELGARRQREGYTLQKGRLTSEPSVWIPFWLLRPMGDGPFPLAIFPHGHDTLGQDTAAGIYRDVAHQKRTLAGDRDVAVQAVRQGFVALAPAVRGLSSEANVVPDKSKRHGGKNCRSHLIHALLTGRTAIGERVWDMSRLLDWAISRDDVDSRTVLMMGNSGGGMVTLYATALDTRITVAVPSCSFSAVASREGHIYHCDCNAVPGILQFDDLYDVAGLAAPRHLLTVSGKHDALHSTAGIERAAARVKEIYEAAGAPERYEHRWGAEGHRFYADLMWPFVLDACQR